MAKHLVILTGPTAIGKTALAIEMASNFQTEIISCDSRQMYRELSIGTAVPSQNELAAVKHHFIHNISIHDYYNAFMFEEQSMALLEQLFNNYDVVFMTGGSGLYIDAVVNGIDDLPTIDKETRDFYQYKLEKEGLESLRMELKVKDPEYYQRVDLKNPKRILKALEVMALTGKAYSEQLTKPKKVRDFNIHLVGLDMDRAVLHNRINHRVDVMVENGLLEEALLVHKYQHLNALNTVGYRELFNHFNGNTSLETAIELIKRNTRRYARRQLSWFRRYENMQWFKPDQVNDISKMLSETIN